MDAERYEKQAAHDLQSAAPLGQSAEEVFQQKSYAVNKQQCLTRRVDRLARSPPHRKAHRNGLLTDVCRHLAASQDGCSRTDGMTQDATQRHTHHVDGRSKPCSSRSSHRLSLTSGLPEHQT